MSGFFKRVLESGGWCERSYRDRRFLPPRAFINPKDFRGGDSLLFALAAPERPRFGPPIWEQGVLEYISEEECEKIFDYHYRQLQIETWKKFCNEIYERKAHARRERTRHRQVKRNKRAYNYWSGYVMGMKVAFQICYAVYGWKPKSSLQNNA